MNVSLSTLHRNKWWMRGNLVWDLAFLAYSVFVLHGVIGTVLTVLFAFLAGVWAQMLLMTEPWRQLSDSWQNLAYQYKRALERACR